MSILNGYCIHFTFMVIKLFFLICHFKPKMAQKSRPPGIRNFQKFEGQFDFEGQGYQFLNLSEAFKETVQV